MRHVRINIRSVANTKDVRKIKRNGRDIVIVPSATLPDNVVMNGILYPAEEIEKSYAGLERTPAPLGHPTIQGSFVSAMDPEGLNIGYIGAWNENVKRKDGRVFLDKVIDVEVANRSEGGRAVLAAIEKGEPIHTSTGLYANLMETGEEDPKYAVCDIVFDHDAILLDEEGAATPEQGVGMMVNGKQVDVINSSLTDMYDDQLDWALDSAARALEQRQRVPMIEKIKAVLVEVFSTMGRETSREQENADMAIDEKKVADLENRLGNLESGIADVTKAVEGVGAIVANAVSEALKSVKTDVEALTNAQKAKDDAQKAVLVNKVTEAGLLSKESAEGLTIAALTELANKVKPGKAANLNPAFGNANGDDDFAGVDFNAMIDEGKK